MQNGETNIRVHSDGVKLDDAVKGGVGVGVKGITSPAITQGEGKELA